MWRASRCVRTQSAQTVRTPPPMRPPPRASGAAGPQPSGDFGRLIRAGRDREALTAFAKLREPNVREAQLAFFAARKVGDITLMERLYPSLHPSVAARATTALMSAHASAGNSARVMELLRAQGPQPSIFSYAAAVNGLGRVQKFAEMESLLTEAEARSTPNAALYTCAMNSYRMAGKMEEAARVVQRMRRGGVLADEMTYNTVFALYSQTGKYEEAERLQAEVEGRGMRLSHSMAVSMLSLCIATLRFDQADQWLARMRSDGDTGVVGSFEAYAAALLSLWKRRHEAAHLRRIFPLYEQLLADTRLKPSRSLLTTVASAAAKLGDVARLREVSATYDQMGYERDQVFLGAQLEAYVRARSEEEATLLFREMQRTKKASSVAYRLMVSLYADLRKMREAMAVFEEAKREQKADEGVYREAAAACERCGDKATAATLRKETRTQASKAPRGTASAVRAPDAK